MYQKDLLQRRTILLTGGGTGLGRSMAMRFADLGANIFLVARREEPLKETVNAIRAKGAKASYALADVRDFEAVEKTISAAEKEFGTVDTLVNNAGINDKVGLEHGTPEQYVDSLGRNLLHYYNMAHFALPYLKKTRGCIVNISSKTALTGQGGTSGYASSKGAILALTREWAAELLGYGIRVNAIVPAEVMTPLYRQWLDTFPDPEEKLKTVLAKIPLEKRMTHPQEIAAMALFLISQKAGHITGQHLFVDGGYVHLDRALT